jgi:peptidoglycan hydrolase-like protein with peptidoglycan-binding domain
MLHPWRPRTLALVVAGGAAIVVVALLALSDVFGSAEGADIDGAATATAKVARRDLVQRSSVSGTLGYDDARALVSYRPGTITTLPEEGRVLRPGGVLYRVDERPIVLLSGATPAWRALAQGVSDGRDVRQLERNLRALGYDDELAVDKSFTSSTAAAVERWQADVGLKATGRVELGDVVFLPGERRVGMLTVALGDPARPGTPVMTTSSTKRLVTAELDSGYQQDVAVGDKVTIDLRNGAATTGTITKVGKVASAPGGEANGDPMTSGSTTSTITFKVRQDEPALAGDLDQAPVDVGVTTERARDALSVPVTALLALRGGRYGVEVVRSGTTSVVEVTPGLYSDGGYVEIERGEIKAGDIVVVPA